MGSLLYGNVSVMQNGENSISKKNICVYAITNHQNTCIFFSIIIRFFRHTSWWHETGITSKDLLFLNTIK